MVIRERGSLAALEASLSLQQKYFVFHSLPSHKQEGPDVEGEEIGIQY